MRAPPGPSPLAGLSAALLMALAGCSAAAGPPPVPSPDQLAREAFANFDRQAGYHLSGSIMATGGQVNLDLTVAGTESVSGHVEDAAGAVSFTVIGGRSYFQGDWPGLPAGLRKFLHARWLTDSDRSAPDPFTAEPGPLVKKLWTKADLEDAFLRGFSGLKEARARLGGRTLVELFNDQEQVYVSGTSKPRLVEIDRPPRSAGQDGFTQVALGFSDVGPAPTIEPPSNAVDVADPSQLPAQYEEQPDTLAFGACDYDSCGARVTLVNKAGKIAPDPAPLVTFTFKREDGTTIDACTSPVPLVEHGATVDVSCRVSGPGWHAFAVAGGHYGGSFSLSNPLYD